VHEEDNGTVAKKHPKRSAAKAARSSSAARRPAAKAKAKAPATAKATAPAKRVVVATRATTPAAVPALEERAVRLRDEILRSKLTHPDPWGYASKARAWGERAQTLVDLIVVRGNAAGVLRTLEALDAEVQRDRDFQEARRLF
jgi:hypothetical protein